MIRKNLMTKKVEYKYIILIIFAVFGLSLGCSESNKDSDEIADSETDSSIIDTDNIAETDSDTITQDTNDTTGSDTETASDIEEFVCPDHAIVALTHDDGLYSQLTNAVPALDQYGFKGTFFLNRISNSDAWKAVSENGHELGAHTLNHPCTKVNNTWITAGNASEDYDLTRMATELDENIADITELGQTEPYSFAYPCGTTWVGEEHTSYIPLITERFVAARGVAGSIVTQLTDATNVPAYFLTGPGSTFTGIVDLAITQNGLVVFGFHDVGTGSTGPVTIEIYNELLEHLDANRDSVTVLPFGQAVQCMLAR